MTGSVAVSGPMREFVFSF